MLVKGFALAPFCAEKTEEGMESRDLVHQIHRFQGASVIPWAMVQVQKSSPSPSHLNSKPDQ